MKSEYISKLEYSIKGFENPLSSNVDSPSNKLRLNKKYKPNLCLFGFVNLDWSPKDVNDVCNYSGDSVIPVYNKLSNKEKTQVLVNTLPEIMKHKIGTKTMIVKLSRCQYLIIDYKSKEYTNVYVKKEYIKKLKEFSIKESNNEYDDIFNFYFRLSYLMLKQSNKPIKLKYITDFLNELRFEYVEYDVFKLPLLFED